METHLSPFPASACPASCPDAHLSTQQGRTAMQAHHVGAAIGPREGGDGSLGAPSNHLGHALARQAVCLCQVLCGGVLFACRQHPGQQIQLRISAAQLQAGCVCRMQEGLPISCCSTALLALAVRRVCAGFKIRRRNRVFTLMAAADVSWSSGQQASSATPSICVADILSHSSASVQQTYLQSLGGWSQP